MADERKEPYDLIIGCIGDGPKNGGYYFTTIERRGGLTGQESQFTSCLLEGNRDTLLWNVGQICQLNTEAVQRFPGTLELKVQPEAGSSLDRERMQTLQAMVASRNRFYRQLTDQQ